MWLGEESIGGLDLTSRARPGSRSVGPFSPDGEAPTASVAAVSGPARSCEGCPLSGGAAVSKGPQPRSLLPVPQSQHAVEKAALSVERAILEGADGPGSESKGWLEPHHPRRLLPPEAPAPRHQCVAPVGEERLGPWRCLISRERTGSHLVLPVLFPLSLSIKRACRLPLQALCLATDLLIRVPTSGEPSVWDLSLKARSLLKAARGHSEPRNAESFVSSQGVWTWV